MRATRRKERNEMPMAWLPGINNLALRARRYSGSDVLETLAVADSGIDAPKKSPMRVARVSAGKGA